MSSFFKSKKEPKIIKQEVLHQGFIEKKSPKGVLGRHVWQARWFVLCLVTYESGLPKRILNYYKSPDDVSTPTGSITVEDIKEIDVSTEKNGRFDIHVSGRTYALRTEKDADAQRWISIMAESLKEKDAVKYVKPSNLPDNPFEAMKLLAADPGEAENMEAEETLMMMEDGGAFVLYTYNQATKEADKNIVMLYLKQDTQLGILHWTEPGENPLEPVTSQSLPLIQLTDLFLGKQTPALWSKTAAHADPEKCFTVKSKTTEFNFEGDTKEQVAAWLFGINTIMTSKGGKKLRNVDSSAPPTSPTSATSKNHGASAATAKKPVEKNAAAAAETGTGSGTNSGAGSSPASNSPDLSQSAATEKAMAEAKSEIGRWLAQLGPALLQYEVKFLENGVDMSLLPSLTEDDLAELGVSSGLHKKKMMKSIRKIARERGPSEAVIGGSAGAVDLGANVPAAPAMDVPMAPGAPGSYLSSPSGTGVRKTTVTTRPMSRSKVNEQLAKNNTHSFDNVLASIKDAKLKSAGDRKLPDKPIDRVDYIGNIALMAAKMAEARRARVAAVGGEAAVGVETGNGTATTETSAAQAIDSAPSLSSSSSLSSSDSSSSSSSNSSDSLIGTTDGSSVAPAPSS